MEVRGHPAAFRLAAAGAWVRAGEGRVRLHLGAGSESENVEASIVWGWTGRYWGGVEGAAPPPPGLSFLPNFPSCSQGRGGVSAPGGGGSSVPEPPAFPPQLVPLRERGPRDPAAAREAPWNVSSRAPRPTVSFVCGRCKI